MSFHHRTVRKRLVVLALDMLTPTEYENTLLPQPNRHTTDPSELTPRNRGTISAVDLA